MKVAEVLVGGEFVQEQQRSAAATETQVKYVEATMTQKEAAERLDS